MSLQTVSMILSATTTTLHHNWAKAMSDALTALGVPKTSDTGQVNLTGSTLAYPTPVLNINAYSGYEIRKLVASGKPDIFIKIHYGIFSNSSSGAARYYPAIRLEIGTGSDGAGNLTSFDANHWCLQSSTDIKEGFNGSNNQPSASAQNCYFASDGQNYLTLVMGTNNPVGETSSMAAMGLERTIDPTSGSYNGKGVFAFSTFTGVDPLYGFVSAKMVLVYDNVNFLSANYTGTGVAQGVPWSARWQPGVNANLFPFTCVIPEPQGVPTIVLGHYALDLTESTQFSASLYGATRNYIASVRMTSYADQFNTLKWSVRID